MGRSTRVLVVDDEESLRHMLSLALSKDGYHVWTASSGKEGLDALKTGERFDICVTDVRMPGLDGLAFIERGARLGDRSPTFIAMSAYGDEKLAVEALRRGAFDYISKPFEPSALALKLRLVVERNAIASSGPETPAPDGEGPAHRTPGGLSEIISEAPSMKKIFTMVKKISAYPTTVLITGETGTGKERIAGAIHAEGSRAKKPFVAVNCGAIPDNLLESELFGHVKGAFTDANQDKAGLFEAANGGTLFLDEIAELPLQLQVKLLRALEQREVRRVGGTTVFPVDVRVIAATAKNVEGLVQDQKFRADLYHRLNVVSIVLPALRDRREDIPVLVEYFVKRVASRLGMNQGQISAEAMAILEQYRWPGNVRELENAIERALVLSDANGRITAADLDDRFDVDPQGDNSAVPASLLDEDLSLKQATRKLERILITRALERTGGNRTKAATLLGISHRALLYKLKEYGIG